MSPTKKQRQRDKYGFKSLNIGEYRFVARTTPSRAQTCFATYKLRYPDMQKKQFLWWAIGRITVIYRVG